MLNPFTLDEAVEICEDFEDLKDTEFTVGTTIYLIEDVTVGPFNSPGIEVFIDNYYSSKDTEKALSAYAGTEYDVIIFAYNVENEADKVHMGIRDYVAQNGISYNFP